MGLQSLDHDHCPLGFVLWLHGMVSLYVSHAHKHCLKLTVLGFPPQAYFNRNDYPGAKCYGFGFGYGDVAGFIGLFESHTALNMLFDLTVFITPMVLFSKPNLQVKNICAMVGVFVIGGV